MAGQHAGPRRRLMTIRSIVTWFAVGFAFTAIVLRAVTS